MAESTIDLSLIERHDRARMSCQVRANACHVREGTDFINHGFWRELVSWSCSDGPLLRIDLSTPPARVLFRPLFSFSVKLSATEYATPLNVTGMIVTCS